MTVAVWEDVKVHFLLHYQHVAQPGRDVSWKLLLILRPATVNKSSLYSKLDHWQISLSSSSCSSLRPSAAFSLPNYFLQPNSQNSYIWIFHKLFCSETPSDWDSIRQTKPNCVFINTPGSQMSQQMCVRQRNQIFINSKCQLTSTQGDRFSLWSIKATEPSFPAASYCFCCSSQWKSLFIICSKCESLDC